MNIPGLLILFVFALLASYFYKQWWKLDPINLARVRTKKEDQLNKLYCLFAVLMAILSSGPLVFIYKKQIGDFLVWASGSCILMFIVGHISKEKTGFEFKFQKMYVVLLLAFLSGILLWFIFFDKAQVVSIINALKNKPETP